MYTVVAQWVCDVCLHSVETASATELPRDWKRGIVRSSGKVKDLCSICVKHHKQLGELEIVEYLPSVAQW